MTTSHANSYAAFSVNLTLSLAWYIWRLIYVYSRSHTPTLFAIIQGHRSSSSVVLPYVEAPLSRIALHYKLKIAYKINILKTTFYTFLDNMDISNFQSADAYGIHSIIIGTTTVVSFFSNSLLIYIVITTKAAEFGTVNKNSVLNKNVIILKICVFSGSYRYLLCFFAICNITTTIGHASFDWVG